MSESDVIRELNLEYVTENPWLVLPISAAKQTNVDQVIEWLIKQGTNKYSLKERVMHIHICTTRRYHTSIRSHTYS